MLARCVKQLVDALVLDVFARRALVVAQLIAKGIPVGRYATRCGKHGVLLRLARCGVVFVTHHRPAQRIRPLLLALAEAPALDPAAVCVVGIIYLAHELVVLVGAHALAVCQIIQAAGHVVPLFLRGCGVRSAFPGSPQLLQLLPDGLAVLLRRLVLVQAVGKQLFKRFPADSRQPLAVRPCLVHLQSVLRLLLQLAPAPHRHACLIPLTDPGVHAQPLPFVRLSQLAPHAGRSLVQRPHISHSVLSLLCDLLHLGFFARREPFGHCVAPLLLPYRRRGLSRFSRLYPGQRRRRFLRLLQDLIYLDLRLTHGPVLRGRALCSFLCIPFRQPFGHCVPRHRLLLSSRPKARRDSFSPPASDARRYSPA